MELSFTEKKSIRKNFGKLKETLSIPNLIDIQKKSYKQFLESKGSEKINLQKGLDRVFKSIFPIEEISEKSLKASSKFISEDNIKNLTAEKATLIWCCKEAIFKWHEKGRVDFINDIKIHPFEEMEEGEIMAKFRGIQLILNYQKINNHYLVYVCSN